MLETAFVEHLFYLVPAGSLFALVYALFLFLSVKKMDEGSRQMQEIAQDPDGYPGLFGATV